MDPKAVVRAFHDAAWTRGAMHEAASLLSPELVDHDPLEFPGRHPGAEGLLQVVGMIRAAIPDLRRDIQDQVTEGARVVTRFIDRGTHQGDLLGYPATRRVVHVRGINIEVVRDDRIQELWHLEDLAGLISQIASSPGD